MTSKKLSPTASLLRGSRLFSLPPPLPRPTNDLLGHVQSNKVSETATIQYPIQQAIMTTPSGLARGDWGLKRQLPLKSTTNTSTPLFRVNAVDTREHITDYDSASDLTLTLNKLLELKIPITAEPPRTKRRGGRVSAFEPDMDNTDPLATVNDPTATRWKYKGPWVAGMTQGDFNAYVAKELKSRKSEFTAFLRSHRQRQLADQRRTAAREAGEDVSSAEATATPISDADLTTYINALRADYNLGSELATLISTFLDLPHDPASAASSSRYGRYIEAADQRAPPTTHPSAGLTYLRSDAYISNHPLLGPQARHAPVAARVLPAPRTSFGLGPAGNAFGKVGVAGVIASPPPDSGRLRAVDESSRALEELRSGPEARVAETDRAGKSIGLGTPGGNRIWVEPTTMGVDARGRVMLKTVNANMVQRNVVTGVVMQEAAAEVASLGRAARNADGFGQRYAGQGAEIENASGNESQAPRFGEVFRQERFGLGSGGSRSGNGGAMSEPLDALTAGGARESGRPRTDEILRTLEQSQQKGPARRR